jgi:hypothetical protein
MTQKTILESFKNLVYPGLRWFHWIPFFGALFWMISGKAEYDNQRWMIYQVAVMLLLLLTVIFIVVLYILLAAQGGAVIKR